MRKKCSVCGKYTALKEILKNKLNTDNVVSDYKRVNRNNLKFYLCPSCGHGEIANVLDNDFYEEFSVAIGNIKDAELTNQRIGRFKPYIDRLAELSHSRNRFLEIGSGCGFLLKAAKQHFDVVVGVEPSKKECDISKSIANECIIINDYFSKDLGLNDKYSAFVATMVFEHIPNIKSVMEYAYDVLEDKGVGLVQVPNGQRTINQGVYLEVYAQHIHYFTPLSLIKLATLSGFDIISLEEDSNRNYLELYVRKNEDTKRDFHKKEIEDEEHIKKLLEEHKNIAIWGAGFASRSFLDLVKAEDIKYFFDMSELKVGKYISDFNKVIELPEKNKVLDNDLIIVLAIDYMDEILSMLRDYGYHNAVVGFNKEFELDYYKI